MPVLDFLLRTSIFRFVTGLCTERTVFAVDHFNDPMLFAVDHSKYGFEKTFIIIIYHPSLEKLFLLPLAYWSPNVVND